MGLCIRNIRFRLVIGNQLTTCFLHLLLRRIYILFFRRRAAGRSFITHIMRIIEFSISMKVVYLPLYSIRVVHPELILFCIAAVGAFFFFGNEVLLFRLP